MKAFATAAVCMGLLASSSLDGWAQISDDVVKIGVLDDMSGLSADIQGPGDVRRTAPRRWLRNGTKYWRMPFIG